MSSTDRSTDDRSGPTVDERARLAMAHVARQHRRIARLEARALDAEAAVVALRSSLSYRVANPLRRMAAAVPPDLYRRVRFGRRASEPAGLEPAGETVPAPAPLSVQPRRALLVDDIFPDPDRDSGSIDIVNLAEALRGDGFDVVFLASRELAVAAPARVVLADRGVRTPDAGEAPDANAYLAAHGRSFDLIVLNRAYAGGRFYEDARRAAPGAVVVFNTVDLHWLRVEREAALTGKRELWTASADLKRRETHLARLCDAVLVVSDAERRALETEVPDALVLSLPLARPVVPPRTSFEGRDGIGFVGGFKHLPNVDGLDWFVREIWPIVERRRPGLRLSVAGADRPPSLLDGVSGRIEPLGHVPDLTSWFETLRLTVAPLRYGAGVKGKVISSLAAGVPCVGTSIAFEGTPFGDGFCGETADDAAPFAEHVVAVHDDPARWSRLSQESVTEIASRYAIDTWRARLHDLLWVLGLTAPGTPPTA